MRVLGGIPLVAGLIALVRGFVRFVVEGFGTPAPVAAPERPVVGGVYRYVRNPTYVAVLATITGQASLFLGRLGLVLYAGFAWLVVAGFVRWYEEPTLAPAASARTTRPTGARCPPGGLARVPGNSAGAISQAQGEAPADDGHPVLVFIRAKFRERPFHALGRIGGDGPKVAPFYELRWIVTRREG